MATILVVDDSMFARLNICNMLKSAGYETMEAADGREGLVKAFTAKPDCIISDLLMPELDGIGLLTALKEKELRMPVIVLTADIQETKRRQCLELGAAGFAYKPPQKGEILSLVAGLLTPGEDR
jgi:twitching motility two-component system response regulator PilH